MTDGGAPLRRVLVVGTTGAGKTTAARQVAAAVSAPFHEMDALAIGPGWSTPPHFVEDVARILAEPRWVFDSFGYEAVRDAMWAAADTVVWLDYPARIVVPRVLRRSLQRSARRTPVFGGNVETWRRWLAADHPLWWAMRTLRARRRYLSERIQAPQWRHLHAVRFRRPAEFTAWVATLGRS